MNWLLALEFLVRRYTHAHKVTADVGFNAALLGIVNPAVTVAVFVMEYGVGLRATRGEEIAVLARVGKTVVLHVIEVAVSVFDPVPSAIDVPDPSSIR